MEEGPLVGGLPSPVDVMVTELFNAESPFVSENIGLKVPVKHQEDEFHVFKDAYLGPADPKEPLLHAFNAALGTDCQGQVKAELPGADGDGGELLGEYAGIPELSPLEDVALLPAPPPPTCNVHFLSSLLPPHRGSAVLPLGAWVREGAAHPGVRVFPVEIKEAGGTITSNNPEEATFQNLLAQESCCKFPLSQEPEDTSCCSHKKDSNPMVICQLKGGTQMLCIDNSGTRELKALHLVPQYQDQNSYLQSDAPKTMTALVGRFLPVPAKLNLITQQLDKGALSSVANGSAFPLGSALPGPPKTTLAGHCDCFASGDFGNNCNCNNCCNNLHHEIERFKAIKAKIMCSSICKCIGCKNYEESPERKTLMSMPNCVQTGLEGSHHLSPTKFPGLPKSSKDRRPSSCISWEVVEATCACLLAQGEEAEKEHYSQCLAEQMILEEFGRCLSQILHVEFKSKGLKME
uniref:tesmin isoform X2 n=1 Tax=Callithrix jacchus TaxID=9483 RepID=UPI0023DCF038|nr:tesmin isoform X2 [Callithrix jacchus]